MKSCLVVDDSRVVRKVARRIAERLGFACQEAEDGEMAFEICLAKMPDMIVLDWNMPIMSGIEFLERLRQSPGGHAPKVLLCTTENDSAHIQRAMSAGADEFMMKPFDTDIMRSKFIQIGMIDA